MHSDWLDAINWKRVVVGVMAGLLGPALTAVVFIILRWDPLGWSVFVLTELFVLAGSVIAAWEGTGARDRLMNALAAVLVCGIVSLIASISVNPQNGANVRGILFLLANNAVLGIVGGLSVPLIERLRPDHA